METPKRTSTPDRLTGEIQIARIRLAKAESQLESVKEQARLAKRRRKEAKQVARRAKKQVRLAKRELAEASLVLAESEEKLARARRTAAQANYRKKRAAKAPANAMKKQPAQSAVSPVPKSVTPGLAPVKSTQPASEIMPVAGGPKHTVAMSMPGNQAGVPAGQAIEEARGDTVEMRKSVKPALETSQTH